MVKTTSALRAASLALRGRQGLLERCREQFAYGHIDWIRKWAKLETDLFVVARLSHAGWSLPSDQASLSPFRSPLGKRLPVLTWNLAWRNAYRAASVPEARAVGAPWLYMLKSVGVTPVWEGLPSGGRDDAHREWLPTHRPILFVPVHSWERDVVNLSGQVDALESVLPPTETTVLLGWGDFLSMETFLAFQRRGYQVVCAGYRGGAVAPSSPIGDRSAFLLNLARIFRRHEIVVSDIPCTALVYASSIGLPVQISSALRTLREGWLRTLTSDHSTGDDFALSVDWDERDFLWDPVRERPSHLNADALAERLGASSLLSPADWRRQFKWTHV